MIPSRPPVQFGATRKGQRVEITVDHKQYAATFLGYGRFSNVFQVGREDVYIFTHFGDYSKEILATCGIHYNPHIPIMEKVESISTTRRDWDVHVYKSRLYNVPLARSIVSEKVWGQHLELRRVRKAATEINSPRAYDANVYVWQNAKLPKKLCEALEALTDAAADYGNNVYLFDDFQPRNLGTDNRGRLMLIDTMFNMKVIHEDNIERGKVYG